VLLVPTERTARSPGWPIPHLPVPSTHFDLKLGKRRQAVFAGRHAAAPTRPPSGARAMVVATRAQAMDARAEPVEVEYEELPQPADRDALEPAGRCCGMRRRTMFYGRTFGDKERPTRPSPAAHVVKSTFNIGRVTAVTMELRSALGDYDKATGRHTLYCGGGGAVKQKAEIAGILGIPPDKVRVLSYDIGGNFGSRNRPYVEYGIVVWAAGKLKRPVKYTVTRSESFLTDYQGRDLSPRRPRSTGGRDPPCAPTM
jgi:carbon-monoxide dehydrogenase large subunit